METINVLVITPAFARGMPHANEATLQRIRDVSPKIKVTDGSVLAQVGFPTMELPILYALTYPDRIPDDAVPRFDPIQAGPLTFEPMRKDAFPTFLLGVEAGRAGGTAPAVFNAANEVAVQAFLEERIGLGRIPVVIERVMRAHTVSPADSLGSVLEADGWARRETEAACC